MRSSKDAIGFGSNTGYGALPIVETSLLLDEHS